MPFEGRKLSFCGNFALCAVFSHEKNNFSASLILEVIGKPGKETYRR